MATLCPNKKKANKTELGEIWRLVFEKTGGAFARNLDQCRNLAMFRPTPPPKKRTEIQNPKWTQNKSV
jgi:hypothetical protein